MASTQSPAERSPLLRTKWDVIAFSLALLGVLGFFYWTAATSSGLLPHVAGKATYTDHYNLLLHGMLKGHLYLDVPVDPAMLRAPNPYDPKVWIPHGWMYDASFYHGKYYIYYGVVPLLVFMLPFRLLTGGDLWLGTAVELSTVLAFLSLAWLWLRIRRDYFPRIGASVVFASILGLGLASGLLSLARRPMMYEFAIATGCWFATLMLHCLYSALSAKLRTSWMVGAGICLGLAFGCRPTFLLTVLAPAWILLHFLNQERSRGSASLHLAAVIRPALGFAAGAGVIGFGVLFYNYLRFSNWFDFGYRYLLLEPATDLKRIWSTSYFWFNLRTYLTSSLEWTRYYPFATTAPYGKWPDGYYGVADVFGLLKYLPMVWLLLAVPLALRKRIGSEQPVFGVVWGMVFLAALGPALVLLCFGTAFARYEVDFLPCLVLASTFGACALDQGLSARWAKHALRGAWVALTAFSVAVACLFSIPLEGTLTVQMGNAYAERVARTLNYPTFLYERARGWHYGPVTWRLTFPTRSSSPREKLLETPNATLLVDYLPESRVRFGLQRAPDDFVLWGEAVKVTSGQVATVSVSFGSLYPTAEHPYYLKHAFSAICSSSVTVTFDGRTVLQGLNSLQTVDCQRIQIADGAPKPGWFSGGVQEIQRNKLPVSAITPDFLPWSLRVEWPASLRPGRWPLISAGTPGAGDLLFLEVESGNTARFGYFSTGSAVQHGPPVSIPRGDPLEFTVRMEALQASGRTPGPTRPLAVELQGRTAWLTEAAYHPSSPDSIRLGANTAGAPSIEPAFPGALRWTETSPRLNPTHASEHLFLRVVFPAQTRWGLREPVLITGVPGAYDGIQVVHYGNGQGRFLLDHCGRLNQEGPVLNSVGGETIHDIEIITPVFSLYHGSRNPVAGTIVVKMDGKEVLRFETELYPAQLSEVSVGVNHWGGPAEKQFVGAILLKRWIDAPAP